MKSMKMGELAEKPQLQMQRRSLYVGDLDPSVTSPDLFNLFSQVGTVSSVRVCCDSFSGNSLGYGYVNFVSPPIAAYALKVMNHMKLKGKPMRIMWCERNPSKRITSVANLYVKNLDSSINDAHLEKIFAKFGTVVSCKVAEDRNGKNKGFGFVQFDKEESAVAALNGLHDTVIAGKKICVSNFIRSSERKLAFTNLYVKNLNKDLTEDVLKEKFSEFGKVTSAVIMRDALGNSRGFGFVDFECSEQAKKAMEALNGTSLLGGEKLFVARAQKKAEREKLISNEMEKSKPSTLFVKNLDPSVDDSLLKAHFRSSGFVTSARVIRYRNGTSKGFGFVRFSNPFDAMRASSKFHGSILQGRLLYVAKAQSREEQSKCHVKQVKPCLPDYPAGKSVTSFSSNVPSMNQKYSWILARSYVPCTQAAHDPRGYKCLNPHPATGNGLSENHKPLLETSRSPIHYSIPSCKKLDLFLEAAQKSGTKLITKEPGLLELSASPNSSKQLKAQLLMLLLLLCHSREAA